MSAPTLSVTVRPFADESMHSWLNRLSARHKVGLPEMLARLDGEPLTNDVGYRGITFAFDALARIARSTDSSIAQLQAMQFGFLADRVLSARWTESSRACGLEWAFANGSHFCPSCLRERDGAWKLGWMFPWSFACLDHMTWLQSVCPQCSQRPTHQALAGYIQRRLRVPRPRHCDALVRTAGGRRIRCGFDLTASSTTAVADLAVLAAQRRLERAMQTGEAIVAGETVPSTDFFVAMRAIVAVWLSVGSDEDFTTRDPDARVAVSAHLHRRSRLDQARTTHLEGGGSPRSARKFRYWRTTPESPGLVAAAAVEAIPIVENAVGDAVGRLGARVRERRVRDRFVRDCHVPVVLAEPLLASSRVPRMLTLPGRVLPEVGGFEARHIPTLFWEDLYAEHLRVYLSPGGRSRRRRFASIALARYVTGETWAAAATLTGNRDAADVVAKASAFLSSTGTREAFQATLASLAARLGVSELIDYADRRRVYAAWMIPVPDWADILTKDGMSPDTPLLYASAYTWAAIVGGSWDDAPCWPERQTKAERRAYRDVIRSRPLRMVLDAFVDAVLTGDRTRFETLPTPSSCRGRQWTRRSLVEARPDVVAEWDAVRNLPHRPDRVSSRSVQLVWWSCGDCGSSWESSVVDRVWNAARCPGCLPGIQKEVRLVAIDGTAPAEYRLPLVSTHRNDKAA